MNRPHPRYHHRRLTQATAFLPRHISVLTKNQCTRVGEEKSNDKDQKPRCPGGVFPWAGEQKTGSHVRLQVLLFIFCKTRIWLSLCNTLFVGSIYSAQFNTFLCTHKFVLLFLFSIFMFAYNTSSPNCSLLSVDLVGSSSVTSHVF